MADVRQPIDEYLRPWQTFEPLKILLANPDLIDRELRRWSRVARDKQREPTGAWRVWFLMTGRAFGKTRTLVEWAHDMAKAHPGAAGFLAGRTLPDTHRVLLHHPDSGLLVTQRPENPCRYIVSRNAVEWENGSRATFFSSEEPDSARGPEHAWGIADEVGTWKSTRDFAGNTLWNNLLFGLRSGERPRMAAATTPRPTSPIVRDLLRMAEDPTSGVVLVRGTMAENSENLPASYLQDMKNRYAGTHLGRQELEGELLSEVENALVRRGCWGTCRPDDPQQTIAVSVDPSGSAAGDEAGVVAAGRAGERFDVLADLSCKASPEVWAARAVELYNRLGADSLVAEKNFGGEMVRSVINAIAPDIPVSLVTATRGKHIRFEPLALRYQRGQVRHVPGLEMLEDQVCAFTAMGYDGGESPGRADALVWAHEKLFPTQGVSWEDLYPEERA